MKWTITGLVESREVKDAFRDNGRLGLVMAHEYACSLTCLYVRALCTFSHARVLI